MSGIVGSRLNNRGSGLIGSLGTDGQVLTSSGAGAGTVFEAAEAGGITMMDAWYTTSAQTHSTGVQLFDSNWDRLSAESAKKMTNIGSAMSESSGVWTFPETGKYWIQFKSYFNGNGNTYYAGLKIYNADDEILNTAFTNRFAATIYPWPHSWAMAMTFLDVDDTTDNKCKVKLSSQQGSTSVWYSSSDMQTSAFFIRMGDS
jgi:hypothetical protein